MVTPNIYKEDLQVTKEEVLEVEMIVEEVEEMTEETIEGITEEMTEGIIEGMTEEMIEETMIEEKVPTVEVVKFKIGKVTGSVLIVKIKTSNGGINVIVVNYLSLSKFDKVSIWLKIK